MKITRRTQSISVDNGIETVDAGCETCQFFVAFTDAEKQAVHDRIGTTKDGSCHIGPPAADGHWPPINKTEWCGGFVKGAKS